MRAVFALLLAGCVGGGFILTAPPQEPVLVADFTVDGGDVVVIGSDK